MSAAVERAGARAVADLADGIAATAALDGIAAERIEGGVRLSGPRLLLRWLTEARVRGLALSVARAR